MKSYLAILRNILLICFLFGFVNAENALIESGSVEIVTVEPSVGEIVSEQADDSVQSDDYDEDYDNFDVVEAVSLPDISGDMALSTESFSDISLDALNAIEAAGPQGLSLKDKISIGFDVCKDVIQQHVSKNKSKYICGATVAIVLGAIIVYYLNISKLSDSKVSVTKN